MTKVKRVTIHENGLNQMDSRMCKALFSTPDNLYTDVHNIVYLELDNHIAMEVFNKAKS